MPALVNVFYYFAAIRLSSFITLAPSHLSFHFSSTIVLRRSSGNKGRKEKLFAGFLTVCQMAKFRQIALLPGLPDFSW
jgi:hypothetical protein